MLAPDTFFGKNRQEAASGEVQERILDAAVEIFVESGYAQACTNHIAARAGVSVGSIYRFFPNKFAINKAIADRFYAGVEHTVLEFMLSEEAKCPWPERVDQIVDRLAAFWHDNAALLTAWNVLVGNPEVKGIDEYFTSRAVSLFAGYLSGIVPDRSPAEYARISRVIYWSTVSMLDSSVTHATSSSNSLNSLENEKGLIDEVKFMIKSYVSALVAARPPEGA